MNLRIEEQEFRFRISTQELKALCNGTALTQRSHLPNGRILEVSIMVSNANKTMSLSMEEDRITLHVGNEAAISLRDALPSREGIEATQAINATHSLQLILEVDIRTQKRKRNK